jgi:glyoxylase-like metal-dependent hydrolase (beta-lactamase superfamily II)
MEVKMLEIRSERGITRPVLLRDDENLILVDTSYPLMADAVLTAVQEAGSDPAALGRILLTHQDLDHMGCVKDILAKYPGIQVLCHEDEAPYIRGERTPVKLQALPQDHELRLAYARRTVPAARTMKDGETLPFCGGILVVHTPGHTPGHLCLYVEKARTLIAGDALNMQDGVLTGPNPAYTQDLALAYRSLEKLLKLDIECVLTFHGGLFRGDVKAALAALLAAEPKT